MVNIRISYEDQAELQTILKALDRVLIHKSIKGYKAEKAFQKRYITARVNPNQTLVNPSK